MDSKTFNSLSEAYAAVYSNTVEETYTVTAADKKGNTPAYQAYKAGKKKKDGSPMYKAADHMKEGVRDLDPEKGTAERKAKLEKKRGMKLDDHPQYKKEEVENVDERYKGKHGQSSAEYKDDRSQGGKMVSGDSKMSGAEYTHGRRVKAANPGSQPDEGGKTKPKSQGKMDAGTRADLQYRKANLKKEELDLFDTVLEYLQSEGIAESVEDAEWMMVNVLEGEDINSILDEARRADKEGYARGSKENPKRNDIPHGDVSQRSMLHSKLKRRADEMGRARRSSARNKAGGRTPVGKKEKAFLQAVTRTAGQVRQPNVPDTGRHKK
ncbi:virion protein [Synechococcus phage S-SCSM1]|uniref:Virion protein n=1 Tax=Synechococcus phage S-SCSM1 TaxID=2588487 RepID=A0A6M2ZII1_9CAUD|nr:virion protein [Synechococcus phage S-SCSM1]QFG06346.1 virion protein [Synechococcus phage S-SCSM1]